MAVPNIFGSATSAIPLSQLDTNFATPVTIGNTAVQLGNTVTSFGNVTLTNVTISSGNVTVSTATVGAGSNTAPSITTTGDTNTGIFFPAADTIAFTEGGAESMRITSTGDVGIGTSSPTAKLDVSGTAKATNMSLNGVAIGDYNLYSGMVTRVSNGGGVGINSANSSDNAYIYFGSGTSSAAQQSAAIGRIGGDVLGMFTASSERMRIDSSGNVLVTNVAGLGYGTGSGGTVTQATSKSTAVTLNKPTGQITMNNAALLANTTVQFSFSNSVVAAIDTVVLTPAAATVDMSFYQWGAATNGPGQILIYLRNISGGSRSEAVVFNFAIIKGATS